MSSLEIHRRLSEKEEDGWSFDFHRDGLAVYPPKPIIERFGLVLHFFFTQPTTEAALAFVDGVEWALRVSKCHGNKETPK
jgi:hypothetical protein